jgi:hypothetical protein
VRERGDARYVCRLTELRVLVIRVDAPVALECRGRVDVVLGTWAYPDGVAAIAIAALLGVPAVVKPHGGDMNVIARLPGS